jgi:hypothetical protein
MRVVGDMAALATMLAVARTVAIRADFVKVDMIFLHLVARRCLRDLEIRSADLAQTEQEKDF